MNGKTITSELTGRSKCIQAQVENFKMNLASIANVTYY